MTIYPTVLYIKQHTITGLKYFGKTTNTDPYKYNGSGSYWLRHIKKHGKEHINTLWVSYPYVDSDLISDFALTFSKEHNIVESKEWANLINENGIDGMAKGYIQSEEHKAKSAIAMMGKNTGKTASDETRAKQSIAATGRITSDETKAKQSIASTGKQKSDEHKANISANHVGMTGRTHSDETKAKMSARIVSAESKANYSIAKTKLHDVLTPDGFVLEQISTKELCSRFNLNYNTALSCFKRNKPCKGFIKIDV